MSQEKSEVEKGRTRRPSLEKTAQTRASIVSAALDTFLERGFSDTRMIDVATRAGVAKGTLYLYFPTKESLFEGVLRQMMSEKLAGLHEVAIRPDETVQGFLLRVSRPLLHDLEASKRGPLIRLVVAESARFPALAAIYRQLVIEPAMAAVRQLTHRALATGELQDDTFARFPQLLVAPFLVGVLWNGLFNPQEPLDLETMYEAYLKTVFVSKSSE